MELFPDGSHVRLMTMQHGEELVFLRALDDGVGIRLSRRSASLEAAWAVHRVRVHGTDYVLLQGAAYERYLGLSSSIAIVGGQPLPIVGGNQRPNRDELQRLIRYAQADDGGSIREGSWGVFRFKGSSVFNLGSPRIFSRVLLCSRAGRNGRLAPLIGSYLPRNQDPMDIVVVLAGTAGAQGLVYPNVDAEGP